MKRMVLIFVLGLLTASIGAQNYEIISDSQTDSFTGTTKKILSCGFTDTEFALMMFGYIQMVTKERFIPTFYIVLSGEWQYDGTILLKFGEDIHSFGRGIEYYETKTVSHGIGVATSLQVWMDFEGMTKLLEAEGDIPGRVRYSLFGEWFNADFVLPAEYVQQVQTMLITGLQEFSGRR